MKLSRKAYKSFLILAVWIGLSSCNEESLIEGRIYNDKIRHFNVDKEFSFDNTSGNIQLPITIDGVEYSFPIHYQKTLINNEYLHNLVVNWTSNSPMGVLVNTNKALYRASEEEELDEGISYYHVGTYPVVSYWPTQNTNTTQNGVNMEEDFYIGFAIVGERSTYGWLKVNISLSNITLKEYAYRTSKTFKVGQKK